jgi:hypothetical protein
VIAMANHSRQSNGQLPERACQEGARHKAGRRRLLGALAFSV